MGFNMNAKIEKFIDSGFGAMTVALFFMALLAIIAPPIFWLFFKIVSFISDKYLAYLSFFFNS